MDKLTHESIDSRLLDILKETDELFQSGQLACPFDVNDLNKPLLAHANNQYTHLGENNQGNVVNNDILHFDNYKCGFQPIKSINCNGHFFSNPINNRNNYCVCVDKNCIQNDNLYKIHDTRLNQIDHTGFIKKNESPRVGLVPVARCFKDLTIVSNWEESQKEVFYNFADKLKQEYQRLQQQLYTQFKLDLEKNINVIRLQYSNTIDELQRDLINLKTFQQAFTNKEAEYGEKILKYENEIIASKQEIENLYKDLNVKREHIMALNKQIHENENAIAELKYGKAALEETVTERNRQLENMEDELSQSLNKSEVEHRKNDTLNQNLLETNAIINAAKNELVTTKREVDRLNSEVERLNGIVKILRETENNLNHRLAEATASNANLVSKLDNLNLEKSALYSRIDEITSGYEKQISICNRRINQLEIQMQAKMN